MENSNKSKGKAQCTCMTYDVTWYHMQIKLDLVLSYLRQSNRIKRRIGHVGQPWPMREV